MELVATQLAIGSGVRVISVVGDPDEALARELGATPVRYGSGLVDRVNALGGIDAAFDAAGKGVLPDAVTLAHGPSRVITLSDPHSGDFGVRLSGPDAAHATEALTEAMTLLAAGRLRLRAHRTIPMPEAAEAHRLLESGTIHERIILTLP
jgi:NADPH:quinone reductase-like Zn-dependent oxidoreductase